MKLHKKKNSSNVPTYIVPDNIMIIQKGHTVYLINGDISIRRWRQF